MGKTDDESKKSAFSMNIHPVFSRGLKKNDPEESELLDNLQPAKYVQDMHPDLPLDDSRLDGEPLHHFERLAAFKRRYPFAEDRSTKGVFLSARCPEWVKEDFEFVCRTVEGEDPAVVLRRLAREYIRRNTPV